MRQSSDCHIERCLMRSAKLYCVSNTATAVVTVAVAADVTGGLVLSWTLLSVFGVYVL
jgi:hypothetical protein